MAVDSSERWRIELRLLAMACNAKSPTGALRQSTIAALARRLLRAIRDNPQAVVPVARELRRRGFKQDALDVVDAVWATNAQTSAEWALACARVWYDTQRPDQGDNALAHARHLSPDWVVLLEEQARRDSSRGEPESAVRAALQVIETHDASNETRRWSEFIGYELLAAGRYETALEYLRSGEPHDPTWTYWYRRAVCAEETGSMVEANDCHARAGLMRHPDVPTPLRTSALHYGRGAIPRALRAVQEIPQGVTGTQLESERLVILARSLLRLEKADDAALYLRARDRAADTASVVQVAALAEELAGHLDQAVEEYRLAIDVHGLPLHHRMARVLHGLGRYQEATEAWIEVTEGDLSLHDLEAEADPDFGAFQHDVAAELSRENYEVALPGLERLAGSASSAKNVGRLHQLLGRIRATAGHPEEALAAFMRASDALVAHPSEAEAAFAPIGKFERYVDAYETLPLDQRTVLYEAFQGAQASCNPLALCRYLLRERPELRHVWAISPGAPIHDSMRNHPQVSFVRIHSDGYRLHLATAGTLITNNSFPRYFVRREGQRYLNTWHGFPWKSLGRDIVGNSYSYSNLARNLLQATHLAFPDEHTARTMLESTDVAGLVTAHVTTGGQARVDRTLTMGPQEKQDLRQRLQLADDRPVVLYAPTWRGSIGAIDASVAPYLRAISTLIGVPDAQVVLSVHHLVSSQLQYDQLPDNLVVVPPDVDTNELLSVVDILVSDYSSVIFDFAPLGRPIIKYVVDHEQYHADRGLYFRIEDVPGINCLTESELGEAVSSAISSSEVDDWSHLRTASAWRGDDGHAAGRIIAALFDESESEPGVQTDQQRVLVSAANPVSKESASKLGALIADSAIRAGKVQLLVPKSEIDQPENATAAAQLHQAAHFTLTMDQRLSTRRENLAWARLEAADQPLSGDLLELVRARLHRERRRIFGPSTFAQVVDFGGQGLHNTALAALGFPRDTRSVHLLHGDPGRTLHGPLEPTLQVLSQFDLLASESEETHTVNRRRLAEQFSVPPGIHVVAANPLDVGLASTDTTAATD